MTDDEINEAIAVSRGWKSYPYVVINGVKHEKVYWSGDASFDMDDPPPGTFSMGGHVPHYTEDLNAMHEVIRSQWNILAGWSMDLRRIVVRDDSEKEIDGLLPDLWFYCATARQRAEAYLRTISRWVD